MLPQIFKVFADRKFTKKDIPAQAKINEIQIWWMFKRIPAMNEFRRINVDMLEKILSEKNDFHSTSFTASSMKEI